MDFPWDGFGSCFLPYRGHWVEVTGAAIPVCKALRGRLENACGLIWEYGSMDFSMGWIRFLIAPIPRSLGGGHWRCHTDL